MPGTPLTHNPLNGVEGRHGADLTPEDLEPPVAEALGRAQGRQDLPDEPWLSRTFLRDYSGSRPARWSLLEDDRAWAQPLVRGHFGPATRAGLVSLRLTRAYLRGLRDARWAAEAEVLARVLGR